MDPWFWVQCLILRMIRLSAIISWRSCVYRMKTWIHNEVIYNSSALYSLLLFLLVLMLLTLFVLIALKPAVIWSNDVKEKKLKFDFPPPCDPVCVQMCRGRAARAEPSSRVVPVRSGPSGRTSITPSRPGSSTHTPTPARQKSSR